MGRAQFGARALTHALALELRLQGVHVALLVADGIIQTDRNPMAGRPPEDFAHAGGRRGSGRVPRAPDAARLDPRACVITPSGDTGCRSRAPQSNP